MKKNLLKSMIALAAFCLGGISAYAQNQVGTGTLKMTVVDYDNPDSIYGVLDTISVGFNKVPEVGGTIKWGNLNYHVDKFGIAKADVSAIPGTVQKATLKMKVSGADNRRTTGWGIALTDNEWADKLTYTIAGTWTVSKLLNGGNQVWSTTKAMTQFDNVELDVSEAFTGGQTSATLIIYQIAAGVCYMTEPILEVEYEPYEKAEKKIDFEDGDVSMFSIFDANRLTITAESNEANGTKVANFTCTSNGNIALATYDHSELTKQAAMVDYSFDFYLNEVSGISAITIADAAVHTADAGGFTKKNNWGYGTKGAIFYVGNGRGKLNGSTNENYVAINGVAVAGSTLDIKAADIWGKWLHADVTVNIAAKTVSYAISDGENVIYSDNGVAWASEEAQSCTQVDVYMANTGTHYLDNLSITNYKSNAVFADYTVQYVDANGKELKEARTGNGQVGKFVTLIDADKAAIYNADKTMKYIYESDNSAEVAIADGGTAVITVTFREAAKYYAVLNCIIEGKDMKTGGLKQFRDNNTQWFWEGDNYYLYPARGYKFNDGKYYFTDATSWNGTTYTFPGSITPNTQGSATYYIGTLYYSAVDSVAYYANFEDLALPVTDEGNGTGLGQLVGTVNSWYSFSGGIFDRFDGGRGIRLDAGSYVYTEPIAEEGAYKVTIYGRNDVSDADANPYALGFIENGSEEVKIYSGLTINSWGSATTGESVVEGVNIPAGAKLVIMNTNEADANSKVSLDDISLTKTGEYQIPTGIKNVEKIQNAGVIYNLAGQKVSNNFKGIVVKDGRKMIQK